MKLNATVWNHGSVGNTEKPCGEFSIVDISSETPIRFDVIIELVECSDGQSTSSIKKEIFTDLPTETWLDVEMEVSFYDGWFELSVISYKESPDANNDKR